MVLEIFAFNMIGTSLMLINAAIGVRLLFVCHALAVRSEEYGKRIAMLDVNAAETEAHVAALAQQNRAINAALPAPPVNTPVVTAPADIAAPATTAPKLDVIQGGISATEPSTINISVTNNAPTAPAAVTTIDPVTEQPVESTMEIAETENSDTKLSDPPLFVSRREPDGIASRQLTAVEAERLRERT